MKGSRIHSSLTLVLTLVFVVAFASRTRAQNAPPRAPDADSIQLRITRARALAASGNLPAARSELESLRGATTDESTQEITLVLLIGIYFEQSDYAFAENLLNEAFRARSRQNEAATRTFYLLAGQAINGVRAQLDRYRAFGLDVSDPSLPEESTRHLERLRKLVENVVAEGRQLRDESPQNIDAAALLENASSARVALARNEAERAQWQREVADVRQRLTGVERGAPVVALSTTQKPAAPSPVVGVTQAVPQQTTAQVAAATPAPTQAATNATTQTGGTTMQPATRAVAPPSTQPAQDAQRGSPSASPAPSPTKPAATSDASATPTQPVEVGSLIARASQTVAPTYPATARSARIGGKVTVYLLLDEKGQVAAVQRSEGPELLRRAAEDAARRWRFRPTVINNQPVRVTGNLSFNFSPQ